MSEQKVQQLLQLAVKSTKSGDKDKGRQAFLAALKLDPNNETGWMGLVSVAKDNRERLTALKKVLQLNPNNDRALAVLDKLGITPERLLGDASADATPTTETEPESDPLDEPFSSDFESTSFMDDIPSSAQSSVFMMDEPEPEPAIESQAEPEIDPEPEPQPVGSAFASPPPMISPQAGVPIHDAGQVGRVAQEVGDLVNDYLDSEYQFDNIQWVRKTKRRAGERDIWKWRAQVFSISALVLIVFVGLPAGLFLSSPEGQRAVFAPTHTQTPTFTFTPSHTPGITPTPSLEPEELQQTPTPTPTFFLQGIQGRLDLDVSPTFTQVYSPGGVFVGPNIIEAWDVIRNEEYREAFNILEQEKLTNDPGYPYPYYLQAQIDLLGNDDPAEARVKLETGEAQLENLSSDDRIPFIPMYHLGHGEVLLYEAIQAQQEGRGDATRLFNEAIERFETAIDLDGRLTMTYVSYAHALVAQGDYQQAVNMLNVPIEGELSNEFYTDILLRVERGRVYFAEGAYDLSLQQANEALFYQPWSEEAYILQAESALAMGRPGVANDYLDGYQLVYPTSLLAFKLEGDAYRLEGKPDQALLAYNIALQDNEDQVEYLPVLEARADLYYEQRRYDLAQEDYSEYLDNRDSDAIRARRMLAAYNAGDTDTALDDAQDLEDSGVVSNGDLALLQGQILVDSAERDNDYAEALERLVAAVLTFGVSQESRPIAEEYLARANYELENYGEALINIDRALVSAETGSRHYIKGLILQAQEDYEEAREEYEFIIAWSQIFPYPFLEDVQERHAEVVDLINNPPEDDEA